MTKVLPAVNPADLIALIDTNSPSQTGPMSCMAAALREARILVGRDPVSGRLMAPRNGMTWAGALVYLIFAEQIGSCFGPLHLRRHPRGEHLKNALNWFGGFDKGDAETLAHLRHRLAHDYTLIAPNSILSFALTGSSQEPVVKRLAGNIAVIGLPALAIRIEHLHLRVALDADAGTLCCHHPGGIAAVNERFWMSTITPE